MNSTSCRYSGGIQPFRHEWVKSTQNPTLAIDRSLLKEYVINSGRSYLSHYNLISGSQLPEQIIIGVVEHDAYNGSINKNPFHFKHFGIKEASIIVNGAN